ncbi:hypothetical protein EVAR_84719_1 [Eumeta japonica]|uniref:Uncharacterized protein n=1 Tax=Eumeta variegata TaxID=151549 RepID=A0A4C1VU76_EUMVA|nr:hypothetical protein EVAR_84719_1 [Eumeta japonica]
MSIGGGLWLLVRTPSSPFDHCMIAFRLPKLCPHLSVVFSTPYALVDVTVYIFLRMCIVGMKLENLRTLRQYRFSSQSDPEKSTQNVGTIKKMSVAQPATGWLEQLRIRGSPFVVAQDMRVPWECEEEAQATARGERAVMMLDWNVVRCGSELTCSSGNRIGCNQAS